MAIRPRLLTALVLTLGCAACSDVDAGSASAYDLELGSFGRLLDSLVGVFQQKAAEDVPIAPHVPYEPPAGVDDPAVDALFDTMGLEEVPTDGDESLDGSMVGLYEWDGPDGDYDEFCFFAQSPNQQPSEETLFWLEFYGVRSTNGEVSDIDGKPIELEVVGGENEGGGETRVIFYVNGVKTDADKHCDTLQQIANASGGVVIGVLNETEGMVKDVWQTGLDRFTLSLEKALESFGIEKTVQIHENKAAALLTNLIVQRIRSGKRVEIWAHSQGGAVTALALSRALRALEHEGRWPATDEKGEVDTELIRVVTFGSASPKWPYGFPKGPRYTHFVHLRDATPSMLGVGAFGGWITLGKKRAGDGAEMIFFDGAPRKPAEGDFDDDSPSDFHVVPSDEADVGMLDLNAFDYHDVFFTYLEMYKHSKGAWNDVD